MLPLLPVLFPFLALTQYVVTAQEVTPGPGKFFFMWPTQVSQCELINLTWGAGAVPPFQAWVVGMGSGGTSSLQIVDSSPNTACLNTASRNQTAKEFSYSVAGRAQQCSPGFELQWDGSANNAPYNFTVIPLSQNYYPFDVRLDDLSGYSSDWRVNMTGGTRFTVVMNDKNNYGSGGAAGIYEVANTTDSSSRCITQSLQGTGAWPIGVATNTLPVATNPPQAPQDTSSGITGGAIAGIVIGVLAFLALMAFLLWFLLRRRRKQTEVRRHAAKGTELDLADSHSTAEDEGYTDAQVAPGAAPVVSPYHVDERYSAVPDHERRSYSDGWRGGGDMSERDSGTWAGTAVGTSTSAGFARLGAGIGGRDRDSRMLAIDGDGREGPRTAGPLPSKSPISPGSNWRMSSPPILSPAMPSAQTSMPNWKRDHLSLPPGAGSAGGRSSSGGMRVVNHDRPDELSAIPPGLTTTGLEAGRDRERRRESRMSAERRMQFRRHEDAGRVDIVDLPPLYTDVPRERPGDEGEEAGENTPLSPNSGYISR